MPKNGTLSGEDKVILAALAIVGGLGLMALVALIFTPTSSGSIIPVLSVAIAAISVLAARHPPPVTAPGETITAEKQAPILAPAPAANAAAAIEPSAANG